jgi:hypothetical protein
MKATPYMTKTGVQIGCMYEPPRKWEASADMENLQTALLHPPRRLNFRALRSKVLWVFNAALFVAFVLAVHYVG